MFLYFQPEYRSTTITELIRMEKEFLIAINFDLGVTPDQVCPINLTFQCVFLILRNGNLHSVGVCIVQLRKTHEDLENEFMSRHTIEYLERMRAGNYRVHRYATSINVN